MDNLTPVIVVRMALFHHRREGNAKPKMITCSSAFFKELVDQLRALLHESGAEFDPARPTLLGIPILENTDQADPVMIAPEEKSRLILPPYMN